MPVRAIALFLSTLSFAPGWTWAHETSAADGLRGELRAISASSARDIWVVGNDERYRQGIAPLALHYDGTTWRQVEVVVPPHTHDAHLTGVSTDGPHDAWAIGTTNVIQGHRRPLVERWDGLQWSLIRLPRVRGDDLDASLTGVIALSPRDVWIVGGASAKPLALHWDGLRLRRVPTASLVPGHRSGAFNNVAAIASDDVWAVGNVWDRRLVPRTLVEHWDGTTWTKVRSPSPSGRHGALLVNVAMMSADDGWAVGYQGVHSPSLSAVTLHWDGGRWRAVDVPRPRGHVELHGVNGASATDVWAVGDGVTRGLILHWAGNEWDPVRNPLPGHASELNQVVALSSSSAWAVGWRNDRAYHPRVLVERWDGTRWSVVI